jgi:hypothetical protein
MSSAYPNDDKHGDASSRAASRVERLPSVAIPMDNIPDEPWVGDDIKQRHATKADRNLSNSFAQRFHGLFNPFRTSGFSISAHLPPSLAKHLPSDQRKRRNILAVIFITMVVLLALILGLAIGLSKKTS